MSGSFTVLYPQGQPTVQSASFSYHVCTLSAEVPVPNGMSEADLRARLSAATTRLISDVGGPEHRSPDGVEVITFLAESALSVGRGWLDWLREVEGIVVPRLMVAISAGHRHEGVCPHDHGDWQDWLNQHRASRELLTVMDVPRGIAYVYEPEVELTYCDWPDCDD